MSEVKCKVFTKKEFKSLVREETYTGWNGHKVRVNAFFFDWQSGTTTEGKYFVGYKFQANANVRDLSKAELFNQFYDWVNGVIDNLPWNVNYKLAITDDKRFKVPLSSNGL